MRLYFYNETKVFKNQLKIADWKYNHIRLYK